MKKHFILIFFLSLTVYFLTSPGHTPYNHFTLLADAFIHGKLHITANIPWLEKIPIDQNNFYVANPPMPAILSIPFVLVFGKNFPQEYLAFLLGSGITILTMQLSLKIKNSLKLAIWSGLLVGFGTIIWFLSSVGSTWYLGQLSATFFLTAALLESLGKKRPWLVGLLIGTAYLSRVNIIVCLPIFIYLLRNKFKIPKNIFLFVFALGTFLATNALYNFLRFGVFWDKGYLLIPGVTTEPWYSKGLINPLYIPNNLKVAFTSLPIFLNKFPFIVPSLAGLAIWITTPAFIFSLANSIKDNLVRVTWLSIFLVSLIIFMHGTTGFTQFGYRFAVDFYPFLIFLTIKGASKSNLKWYHWLILIISILVNLWGVLWINKFSWVVS